MKILAFDTSSQYLSIAISKNASILSQKNIKMKQFKHNRELLPKIDYMLKKNKLAIDDIDIVSMGKGPGSFTGLRIGLALAKGLVFMSKRKLHAVSSFDAAALNVSKTGSLIAVIEDARKQRVYGCLYKNENELERLTDYSLLRYKDFKKLVKKNLKKSQKEIIFLKNGLSIYREDLRKSFTNAVFADEKQWISKASNIAKLTYLDFKSNKINKTKDREIEPLYLHSQYANITKPRKI
jgi:tRNA threonylcarbamoyladenosine biosynthesis protein TsaB